MEHLYEKLKLYSETDMYPFHMPGHKRRACGNFPEEFYRADITEIDGFDNLHQPEEILLKLQQQAAGIYGAEESFYLVNGSTCGILSAISAALPENGHILMTRNCHKSVYYAAYLRNLTPFYLYPDYIPEYDICDAILPEQVKAALEKEPDVQAVLIVSPTYEGRIADVEAIAEIVHERGIPLIVDEAHGAHLGFAEGYAKNSCQCGADLVIHSVHKTLPAMTQTALLHVNGPFVDRERLRRFLRIYQSSSPSYVLMASIDNALEFLQSRGKQEFLRFRERYLEMCGKLSRCKKISFLQSGLNCQDVGKLLISVKDTTISGKELYNILREEYHLQLEMAAKDYVLAMFTVNDSAEAYERMVQALLELDERLEWAEKTTVSPGGNGTVKVFAGGKALPMKEAWDGDSEWVLLEAAVDRPVAEFVNLYPPGIPLLVPGESMTADMAECIRNAVEQGLTVQGIEIRQVACEKNDMYQIGVKVTK